MTAATEDACLVVQPAGTVTLLFSDIEGSTRLLDELGAEAYRDALAEHRRVLRASFERHGGYEVDYQGDAFFVAFADAGDAVAAAEEGQAGLAEGPIRVRMGLHTGTPLVDSPKYVGVDVHLAARVMSAGHGGQVVLTDATRSRVDVVVSPLGEHRLKDIESPIELFQLGETRFPPLKTISNTNLPRPASSFLGREAEVAEVVARVRAARLVTLTGPGGTGKTRLAIEAAAELVPEFTAGVFWVGLATVRDPLLVVQAIAQTLGADGDLADHIGEKALLLVLDNFEQVVAAASELSTLLRACPNLHALVTSRELLRIDGEREWAVPPLGSDDAVDLFCARSGLDPSPDVRELCRRLDDMPLAVELAAARASVLSPAQILERLGQRLDLLRGGRDRDPRQQTLRTTIEWSYELLSNREQQLFADLAAFDGGAELEAIESVTGADLDTLQPLVDKSLVRHTGERFWMLETIRDYALEQLARSGRADEIARAHAGYFLALGVAANLTSESDGGERPALVRGELDNFRRAIDWAAECDLELAYRLAISLEQLWVMHDPLEGARRMTALLERDDEVSPVLRARALRVASETSFVSGDYAAAAELGDESLAAFRELGDERAVAVMLHRCGVNAQVAGDVPRARELLEQSLAITRTNPNPKLLGDIMLKLGSVERSAGNLDRALVLFEEGVERCRDIGFAWMQASALLEVADVCHRLGRSDRAWARALESLGLCRELGERRLSLFALGNLARFAADGGRIVEAGRIWGAIEAEEMRAPVGNWELHRGEYAAAVLAHSGPELEAAREAGRRLTLEEAAAWVLSVDSPS